MRRAKYEVYKSNRLAAVYVTEKKNAEYMLQQIRSIHEKYNSEGKPYFYKVFQVIEGERKLIYTPRMRNFWGKVLEV